MRTELSRGPFVDILETCSSGKDLLLLKCRGITGAIVNLLQRNKKGTLQFCNNHKICKKREVSCDMLSLSSRFYLINSSLQLVMDIHSVISGQE